MSVMSVSSATGAADATDVDERPPTATPILYRHAIESIFAFLDLHELATALQVARDWMAAVRSMRRLDLAVVQPSAPLAELARSMMGRHIGRLGGGRAPLCAADLTALADRMPQLRNLGCRLAEPPADRPLLFPANLRVLHIQISGPSYGAIHVNSVIASTAQLPLLERLHIGLPEFDPQLSFAPLAALPQLRSFGFQWLHGGGELSDAQVDQLRAMTRLRTLDVPMTTALLRRLLRQPHDLQWQQLSLPEPLDDDVAALLPQLPSLTVIRVCEAVRCERFDWLRGLPNLTDVTLMFEDAHGAEPQGRADSLVAGLQCCANIKILSLSSCFDLTAAHLADLLPRLPRLRELELIGLLIDSLSFLAQPPLTSQLRRLELLHCIRLPLSELRHVHTLRSLERLELWSSFSEPLDSEGQSLLTPPSAVLPLLESFHCYAPQGDGEYDSDNDANVSGDEADQSESESGGDAAGAVHRAEAAAAAKLRSNAAEAPSNTFVRWCARLLRLVSPPLFAWSTARAVAVYTSWY